MTRRKYSKPLADKYKLKPKYHNTRWTDLQLKLLVLMVKEGKSLHHCGEVLRRRDTACHGEFHRAATCDLDLRHHSKHTFRLWRQHEHMLENFKAKHGYNFSTKCRH